MSALGPFSRLKVVDRVAALKNILVVVQNILDHPGVEKYRRVRHANELFLQRGGRFPETSAFMVGFLSFEDANGFLTAGPNCTEAKLREARELLSAEIEKLEEEAQISAEVKREEDKLSLVFFPCFSSSFEIKILLQETFRELRKRKVEEESIRRETMLNKIGQKSSKHARHPRGELGYVGIVNLGATCYLNSAIQCLFHVWPIRTALFNVTTFSGGNRKVQVRSSNMWDQVNFFISLPGLWRGEYSNCMSKDKRVFGYDRVYFQIQCNALIPLWHQCISDHKNNHPQIR